MAENENNENKPVEGDKPAAENTATPASSATPTPATSATPAPTPPVTPAAAAPATPPAPPAAPVRPAPPKNPAEDELRAKFGDKIELKYGIRDLEVHLKPENIIEICEFLKKRPSGPFTFLRNLTAVDWKDDGVIELIIHIAAFPNTANTICIKCRMDREAPSVASVTRLWPSADWLEREVFDLFGVNFEGHPDLRRIMLPPEWEGHPLRKDYIHKEPELPWKPR